MTQGPFRPRVRRLNARSRWFVAIAAIAVAGFIQLGGWQLRRLGERRAANAAMVRRREEPRVSVAELARDPAAARFRSVRLTGRFDYEHQFLWTARTRNGAPGVVFLTPLLPDSGGPAVLVNRGWAYAADGMRIDIPLWNEAAVDTVEGYAEVFGNGPGPVQVGTASRGIRRLAFDSLQAMVPYPLAPVLAVQQRGAGYQGEVKHPFRVELPPLDEGSHRGYALQWFAFALITIVGTGAVLARELGRGPDAS